MKFINRITSKLLTPVLLIITVPLWSKSDTKYFDFSVARLPMYSITLKESQHHVKTLASAIFQGRATGSEGQRRAARYIADEFAQYGLLPGGGNNQFYQRFKIIRTQLAGVVFAIEHSKNRTEITFGYKTDFWPLTFSGENEVAAEMIFVGYGITAPELGYDSYKNTDVRNKIVLVLSGEPQQFSSNLFPGNSFAPYVSPKAKAKTAARHGAAGMLLISDQSDWPQQDFWLDYAGPSISPRGWRILDESLPLSFPALRVTRAAGSRILEHAQFDLGNLQRNLDNEISPHSFPLKTLTVKIEVELATEILETENVIAIHPGGDPQLSQEAVVVGAHFDHLGEKNGRIYYGADDNASGTAGLLEIAEAFSEMPLKPKRSIIFIAFSAEELGLLGSEYYVGNPSFPLDKTVTMINLDMISRNEPNNVSVIGSNRSPELFELNEAANQEIGLTLDYNGERYFTRSDQFNFAEHRIPVIFYNTASHHDYHKSTDVAEKTNPEKIARISRLAFLVAWQVANAKSRPTYQPLFNHIKN